MKKLLLGTAVSLLAASTAFAQDYQVELGLAYVNGDLAGIDYDGYGINAQFNLDKVDTSKGPLGEATFLDKSSFVNLTWISKDPDVSGADSVDDTSLSGRFVTKKNLIIEASYHDMELIDDTVISLGVGTYLNDNTDVVVSYQNYDEADASTFNIDSHGVNKLSGETSLAYDLGVSYIDEDSESGYELRAGADYYANKALSFGASVSLASIDDVDVSEVVVNVSYFATPVLEIGFDYETLGQDADGDMLALSAAFRF